MRKSYVALLLMVGAVAFTAGLALAQEENGQIVGTKLMNARMSQELLTRAAKLGSSTVPAVNDTVFVGYNSDYAGSNYWSIGQGDGRYPVSAPAGGYKGLWTWEYPIHSDSLEGWWPIRMQHTNTSAATRTDVNRPWWAIEMGN